MPARPGALLALSPNTSVMPFAGARLDGEFRLPEELAAALPAGPLYLRVFDGADGQPLETFVWERPARMTYGHPPETRTRDSA